MFSQVVSGKYKDDVHFFAGTADGVVHVTITDENGNNTFYDFMKNVSSQQEFEEQIKIMCEDYLQRFINGRRISKGQEDNESIVQSIPTMEIVSASMET